MTRVMTTVYWLLKHSHVVRRRLKLYYFILLYHIGDTCDYNTIIINRHYYHYLYYCNVTRIMRFLPTDLWSKEESTNEDLLHPMSLKVKSMCAGEKQRYVTDGKHNNGPSTLPMTNEAQASPLSSVFTVKSNSSS